MDFTALSNKLRSLDPTTPQEDAAKLKAIATGKPVEEVVKQPITESVAPVQLDEMAQFKALAGIAGTSKTTKSELALEMAALAGIVNESKEVVAEAEQVIKAEKKQELPSKKSVLMMCSKGMSVKEMCEEYPDCDQEKLKEMCEACMKEYKMKKDESFDSSEFRKNFEAMVEAKKKMPMGPGPDGKKGTDDDKPAFLDQKTGAKKSKSDKKGGGMTDKQKKYFGKKNESIKEGQHDGKSREELMKMKAKAEADIKNMQSSGDGSQEKFYDETQMMMAQQYLKDINDALAKIGEASEEAVDTATSVAQELKKMGVSSDATEDEIYKMIPKALKSLNLGSVLKQMNMSKGYRQDMVSDILDAISGVGEADEERKPLSFKDLLGVVRESGGQQQIDCVDTTLWTWAQRVANAKYEGTKAEVFAGMLYERNGGRFEMHDMLSEDK